MNHFPLAKARLFLTLHATTICLVLLFALSFLLRVYDFPTRWGLASDDSRDAMIGQETIRRGHLPLIGSFSSAGPFVFGPLFYWYIAGTYLVLPGVMTAPWIVTLGFGLALVFLAVGMGKLLGGRKLGLLLGLLTAVSPQMVGRSVVLTQHTFVGIATASSIFFLILTWQKKRAFFAFLMGIFFGLGISMHYQAVNLVLLFVPLLIIPKTTFKRRIALLLVAGLGSLVPALPLLIWDSQQHFANTRNIMDFFLIAQYRFYVASSWKLFLFSAMPTYWAYVIGGFWHTGIILLFISLLTILFQFVVSKGKRTIVNALGVIFIVLLILNRYYRGERFEGYLIYFAPFILIFTGFFIYSIARFNKLLGFVVCLAIVVGSLIVGLIQAGGSNNHVVQFQSNINVLKTTYPQQKFLIYDQDTRPGQISQPISFLLSNQGLTSPTGYPIGICEACSTYPILATEQGYFIVDISKATPEQMKRDSWHKANPENMYDDLITWSEKNKLPSSFSLDSYILERLHLKSR